MSLPHSVIPQRRMAPVNQFFSAFTGAAQRTLRPPTNTSPARLGRARPVTSARIYIPVIQSSDGRALGRSVGRRADLHIERGPGNCIHPRPQKRWADARVPQGLGSAALCDEIRGPRGSERKFPAARLCVLSFLTVLKMGVFQPQVVHFWTNNFRQKEDSPPIFRQPKF